MLRVSIDLLAWPYVSRPLEKGRAKRRIEMRQRRITGNSLKHARWLCRLPCRHPERSRRIYPAIAVCMPTVSFAFHAIRPAEMHESDPVSLAFIPLLLLDPSTSLRMTGDERWMRNKERFPLGI